MTKEQVIAMAREAGFAMENSAAIQAAERFATLVRNAALEECAVEFEGESTNGGEVISVAIRNLKEPV